MLGTLGDPVTVPTHGRSAIPNGNNSANRFGFGMNVPEREKKPRRGVGLGGASSRVCGMQNQSAALTLIRVAGAELQLAKVMEPCRAYRPA